MIAKKMPWATLGLLSITYIIFGWFLAGASFASIWLWVAITISIVLLDLLLLDPIGVGWNKLFRSTTHNAASLILLITWIALIGVILYLLRLIIYLLILFSAETLTRLDLQTAGYSQLQVFLILMLVPLSALGVGWGLGHLVLPR